MSELDPSAPPEEGVLVVGGGPVGLACAVLLARQGVPTTIVERRTRTTHAPKAHVVNPRTLEICHAAGLDVAAMRARATSDTDDRVTRFVTRVMDRELGSMPFERHDDTHTPFPRINLAQPVFEELLLAAVREQPLVTLADGHEWLGCRTRPDGRVVSTVDTAQGAREITSRYVVGADGANSRVRTSSGIAMTGAEGVQHCLTISFEADWRELLRDRPSMFYWALGAKLPGVFLAYDMASTWTYLVFDAPERAPTPQEAHDIVLDAVGAPVVFTVRHVLPWGLTAQVAERYRQGPVFLVGDAAHRFPPTGGLGLNTGVQDAHNLAWKISAVVAGRADDDLLDSYERERRPVAELNTRQSMRNAEDMLGLLSLTGDEDQTVVDDAVEQTYEAFNSLGLQLGFSYGADPAPATIRTFTPTARVGDRLPHAWLEGPDRRSVLDLLDDRSWTLLTAEPASWKGMLLGRDVPCRVVDVVDERAPDAWRSLVGLTGPGAVLVRPDGHIAARPVDRGELDADVVTKGITG